ncbi:MAG: 5-methyltetrahydrofolate--homocysteine methyltransferase [Prevotellaceae bacterium]|jgi:cobalamin-dependent methionine synthase I|nr:5-methyltetrahydrofolate--homocysteine methyltransferase [Prevotellaceae bacterium]
MIRSYSPAELLPSIDWVYFFHSWNIRRSDISSPHALELKAEALQTLQEWEDICRAQALAVLFPAWSDGDNLLVGKDEVVIPLLRQQTRRHADAPFLCLSDFVRPKAYQGSSEPDTIGIFATSVHTDVSGQHTEDVYNDFMTTILCERLAEAAAAKIHEEIRIEKPTGIRPAVGYPCLPDLSVNFILDQLTDFSQIGIRLTENGMMQPNASVSGLILFHPAARYFAVGKISDEQWEDYAKRRDLPAEVLRKFLGRNL